MNINSRIGLLLIVVLLGGFISLQAADQSEINEMLQAARETYDLEKEDAVILLDDYRVEILPDGRVRTTVHQIIWIANSRARGHYADLRIPFDASRQNFVVTALNTWRGEECIKSDSTAIVETLPFSLRTAYDYANMREMILMHDGIELPCVVETAYYIEDKEAKRKGVEGLWVFAKHDPVLQSRFGLTVADDKMPSIFVSEEVSTREVSASESGQIVYKYEMNKLPALPSPDTVDPAAYMPHVSWSTWDNWNELGEDLIASFESGLELNDALKDSLSVLLDGAWTMSEKAKRIAAFVDASSRYVNYPKDKYLWYPRPAKRTYETAYGHRFDRAILAGALFKEAGFMVFPIFKGEGYGKIDEEAPCLSRMDGIAVWISHADGVEAYYNPVSSEVHNGLAPIFGRSIWFPGSGEDPNVKWRGEGTLSNLDLKLSVKYDAENEQWQGSGFYCASNWLNPFGDMEGLSNEASNYLQKVVSDVIVDAEIVDYSPVKFNRFELSVGFEFTAPIGDEDDYGRRQIIIGEPKGGLYDKLPSDVDLSKEYRGAPVVLAGLINQTISFRLDTDGLEIVYSPDESPIRNDIGEFQLSNEKREDCVIITRSLSLSSSKYDSEDWQMLRKLLLTDRSDRSRTLLVRIAEED
ncbi:MAG: DUF3857 domain-containing protein [Calditrichaeota bacterium]|nr:DUF3857 domain-containing protein [Calditrichota bacterium]